MYLLSLSNYISSRNGFSTRDTTAYANVQTTVAFLLFCMCSALSSLWTARCLTGCRIRHMVQSTRKWVVKAHQNQRRNLGIHIREEWEVTILLHVVVVLRLEYLPLHPYLLRYLPGSHSRHGLKERTLDMIITSSFSLLQNIFLKTILLNITAKRCSNRNVLGKSRFCTTVSIKRS